MPSQTNSQSASFTDQSDMLNVMIKKELNKVDTYEQELIDIDTGLKNAKASLQNIPGVQTALDAIDRDIQANYKRGNDLQTVRQYEAEFFQTLSQDFAKFKQAVDALDQPNGNTNNQLKLENSMQSNSINNTQNIN